MVAYGRIAILSTKDNNHAEVTEMIDEIYSEISEPCRVFKLNESLETQDRAIDYLGLAGKTIQSLKTDYHSTKYRRAGNIVADYLGCFVHCDNIVDDIYNGTDITNTQRLPTKTVNRKKLLQLKIIRLKADANMKNRVIAQKCMCSEAHVSRVLWSLYTNEKALIDKLKPKSKVSTIVIDEIRQIIKDDISQSKVVLQNYQDLKNYLQVLCEGRVELTNWQAMKLLRKELPLVKYKPKRVCPIVRQPIWYRGQTIAHKAILHHLGVTKRMVIFDSTSFVLNHNNTKLWSIKGLRPTLKLASTAQYLYVHVAINHQGLVGLVLSKTYATKESINISIYKLLEKARQDYSTKDKRLILFLNNSPLHDSSMLSKVASFSNFDIVYNVPSNPSSNPIEDYFGGLKNVFSKVGCNRSYIDPWMVLETVKDYEIRQYQMFDTCYSF